MAASDFLAVPIPARMAHLEKDRRGYPIPAMVQRDAEGRPHFQINDEAKRQHLIGEDRCPICAGKLFRGRWFVGGPLSAFSNHGNYIDSPMHAECATYALRVCPYLAAPHYGKSLGFATVKNRPMPSGVFGFVDQTAIEGRPNWFVAVMAVAQDVIRAKGRHAVLGLDERHVRYVRHRIGSVRDLQVWLQGEQVTDRERLRDFGTQTAAHLLEQYNEAGRSDMWDAARRYLMKEESR